MTVQVRSSFTEVLAGEQVEVAMVDYGDICSLSGPLRAVVEIDVQNTRATRPGSSIYTGRASVVNPCEL